MLYILQGRGGETGVENTSCISSPLGVGSSPLPSQHLPPGEMSFPLTYILFLTHDATPHSMEEFMETSMATPLCVNVPIMADTFTEQ